MKIVVIGATGTIGKAVADALAARHDVIRASRNGEARVDVEDATSVGALFDKVKSFDALVNCVADVSGAVGPLDNLRDDQLEIATRVQMAMVKLVRTAIKHVQDGGSITLTSGVLARLPRPGSSLPTMAAAGLEGFVRASALEMSRGVRINAVAPGAVKETMAQRGWDSTAGMPARTLANYYVSAVEGTMSGTIIVPTA
jgi:NAD(P)-dependent dehydrogenase (short-subunit alcohol dehydrogenase family)